MKISRIRTTLYEGKLSQPYGDANFPEGREQFAGVAVFVDTDEGITGVSNALPECRHGITLLEPLLLGEDPRAVRSLWQKMIDQVFKGGNRGIMAQSISVLDVALWDLKAKANDEPLWKTLGAGHPRVKAYASGIDMCLSDEEMRSYYANMAAKGFGAGKLKVGRNQDDDLRRLGIMRDALSAASSRPVLAVDSNEYWSPKQAIRRIREMEEQVDLAWCEEPARRWDVQGLRKVSESVKAAVATGENLDHVSDFMPLVTGGAVDIVQVGLRASGITGGLQVAHLAYAHELPVCMMNSPGHILAHLSAAIPNHVMTEVFGEGEGGCYTTGATLDDGCIVLGDRPGTGMEFDEAKLKACSVDPGSLTHPMFPGRGDAAGRVL